MIVPQGQAARLRDHTMLSRLAVQTVKQKIDMAKEAEKRKETK